MGPPGCRKTTLGLQFPDVLVLDCDRNLSGPETYIRKHNPSFAYAYNPIRYDSNGVMRDIEDCYDVLCGELTTIHKDPNSYKAIQTVFTDSLSHVNEFVIRHVLKLQNKTKRVFEMEQRDWNPFKSFSYIFLVARLEQTNKNILCSCHESKLYEKDPKDQSAKIIVGTEPLYQGAVGDMIGGFFTDVWRLDLSPASAGRLKWVLQTQRTNKCEHLKNSLDMPPEIELPEKDTFKTLLPYFQAKGYYR